MKTLRTLFYSALTLAALCFFTGCEKKVAPPPPVDTRPDFFKGLPYGETEVSNFVSRANTIEVYLGIIKFGDNVYYFPYVGETFGKALQKFLIEKPEIASVSLSGDSADIKYTGSHEGHYSTHAGYWVICTFKPKVHSPEKP